MLGFMTKERRGSDEENAHDGRKPTEVIGTSTVSFEDAVAKGVGAAAKRLQDMSGADVKHLTVAVKNGKVTQYRADLKIAFAIEPDEADDDD